jgi:hypothetical protein
MRDPLRQFVLHAGQRQFIEAVLRGPHSQVWAICANRYGKSDALAYCAATLARYGIEPTRPAIGASTWVYDRATSGWVIGPDYQTLMHTLLPKILDNGYVPPGQSHGPFIPPWELEQWNTNE